MKGLLTVVFVVLLVACSNQSKDDLLNSGISSLRDGNTRGAIVYLRNALKVDPDYYEARYHLGDAYLQAGQYQQAENEFEKVYRQNAAYSDLLLKLAQIYRQTERFDKSIEILATYHQNNPPSSNSLDLLGVVNALKQQFQIADSFLVKAAELDPDNPLPVYHLAQSYLSQSKLQDAKLLLEKMQDNFSGFNPAYELLAEFYLSQNRVDEAIETYRRLFVADPNNVQALYMRGLLLLTLERSAEAVDVVALFAKQFPDDYRGEQLMGMAAYKNGYYDEALVHLRQSLKIKPQTLTNYYLGLSHSRQNEFELAINQYQRVLDAQPGSSQARLMLAMTFLIQKRVEDCLQQTRYVLKNDPNNGLAYNILGSAYLLKKEYDDALIAFNQALEVSSELIDVHLKKSRSYALRGEADRAEHELVTALAKSPDVLNTRLPLASHHARSGNYDAAANVLREGLSGSSADALIYSFLAGIAINQSKQQQAISYLQKAKKAEPSYRPPYFMLAEVYLAKGNNGLAIEEYKSLLSFD
jgi:putative PEP-CTERM system TPR-repeat lipoprotein